MLLSGHCRGLNGLKEEYKSIVKKVNEIQTLLRVMAKRIEDDYLKVELLVLHDDFGDLADKFVKAFKKYAER